MNGLTLTLKATVLLLFAFGGSAVLRRASAASRALLWQAAALGLFLMGGLALWGPTWNKDMVALPVVQFDVNAASEQGGAALPWLKVFWLAGMAFVLLRMVAGHCVMAWVARRAPHRLSGPVTWGLLRPEVLLPPSASSWSEETRRTVLLHEGEHIRRRDPVWQFAWQLICAALWFHPLAWMALGKFRNEAEQACDDAVLSKGVAAPDYAELLLRFAAAAPPSPVALGMQGHADFRTRVQAILNPGLRRGGATAPAILMAALALAVAVPVAAVADQQTKEKKPAAAQKAKALASLSDPDVTRPRAVKRDEPKYTEDAKDAKVEGTVLLLVVIDEQGKVAVKEILRPLYPSLDASAVETVAGWEFEPARKAGKPVAVEARIEIHFKLL